MPPAGAPQARNGYNNEAGLLEKSRYAPRGAKSPCVTKLFTNIVTPRWWPNNDFDGERAGALIGGTEKRTNTATEGRNEATNQGLPPWLNSLC
jgi:hypothetical protein